jgi:hypothetical protein
MNWYKISQHNNGLDIDVDFIYKSIYNFSEKYNFKNISIGEAFGDPILLLSPPANRDKKNILVAAGFHGDEPSGCYGILNFIDTDYNKYKEHFNIHFLPIVNPSGIRLNTRLNKNEEDPNRGFIHNEKNDEKLSIEGKILVKNKNILLNAAKNGFLTLHEDIDKKTFYLYSFEKSSNPSEKSISLLRTGENFFKITDPDNIPSDEDNIKNNIAFKECDGSFEDFVFHNNSSFCACTETPAKEDFKKRNKANKFIISSFLDIVKRSI